MLKIRGLLLLVVVLWVEPALLMANEVVVQSPDGQKTLTVFPAYSSENGQLAFSVHYGNREIILPSVLELNSPDIDFSRPFSVEKVKKSEVESQWSFKFGERSSVPDNYNEVKIFLESKTARLNLICRAYNEGVAFCYEIPAQSKLSELTIDDEIIRYRFADDHKLWSTPERTPKRLTAQGEYRQIPLSELKPGCERPLLIEIDEQLKIALAEARMVDYARLSFGPGVPGENSIVSCLDGRIEETKQDEITGALENERSNKAKAKVQLPFKSPWRVVMMGKSYGELLENNYLILNLNPPCALSDVSWITPGKALREGTLTTQGAMAAIDFVASHNMQYVHFDAGWYGNEMSNASDATTITLDPKRSKGPFELEKITAYAKEKGVKVMLYVNRRALEKQLDDILPLYKKWGVAGIKFGFVRVGDQEATTWLHEAIKKCAQYGLVVDVHDEYRPTGFSRTYPNLLTQEGIRGDEETVPNRHTLITMFTRMLAGAADNTVCYYNKRVEKMGSHASQLAKTVCIFSPLQFLYWYDKAPAAPVKDDALWGNTNTIGNEPELEFLNNVPTVWDETKVLTAEIGEIGVIARRKGNDWWIGGINGETARTVELDFSFLTQGKKYSAKIYTDDETVKTRTRVKIEEKDLDTTDSMKIDLKANNGFAMHIKCL